MITKLGSKTAELVEKALEKASGPRLAAKGGLGTQSIYNFRDGELPGRLAIPALARALGLSAAHLRDIVNGDRAARAHTRNIARHGVK